MPAPHGNNRIRGIGAFLLGWALLAPAAQAGTSDFFLGGGGGDYAIGHVHSLLDSHFRSVVHQRYDYSCGSAALATLLTYHYGHPIDERDVLRAMFEHGDKLKIEKLGFSMLDMKKYLSAIGYHAEGYRESLDRLKAVGIPAIVLVNKHGYMHFVVVKGVSKDKVAIGDPSAGLRIYDRAEFEKTWNGILFVILDDQHLAQASFNTANNWHPNGVPQFRHMLDRGELGALTIDISPTPNYY